MAATLTSTGLIFGDSTVLNSRYEIIAQSSSSIFYEVNAPVGWAKATANTNKALRVTSGSGGVAGGTIAFSTAFPSAAVKTVSDAVTVTGTVAGRILTEAMIPSHNHPGSTVSPQGVNHDHDYDRSNPLSHFAEGTVDNSFYVAANTGPDGSHAHTITVNNSASGGGSHTHPWAGSGTFSDTVDTRVKYVDVIVCSLS